MYLGVTGIVWWYNILINGPFTLFQYSLPRPRGGKHCNNPVLFEDQPQPQQRATKKSRDKVNVLDADYVAGYSPFSLNDVTSRAAQLGIHGGRNAQWNRRNPNDMKNNLGRRK